jgi:hypothetical protein
MYVKLTNKKCIHNEHTFHEGENIDKQEYGIFFTDLKHVSRWILYSNNKMYYIWDVEIPDGVKVTQDVCSYNARRLILKNKRCIYEDEDLFYRIIDESGAWVARDVPDMYITQKIYDLLIEVDPHYKIYLSRDVIKKYQHS